MAFLRVTNDSKMNCSDLLQPLWCKISYEVTVNITLCLSAISGQGRLTNTGCPNNMHNIILGGPSTFPCWLESVIFYFYCGTTKLFDNATNSFKKAKCRCVIITLGRTHVCPCVHIVPYARHSKVNGDTGPYTFMPDSGLATPCNRHECVWSCFLCSAPPLCHTWLCLGF